MKKPRLIRLRLMLGLHPGSSRRRGVAIITVLAIVSLMTVLVISFFQMAQTAKTTAVGSVELDRVGTLKDVITNFVTAQIREATTLPGNGGTQTIWTSQPGAIRTYHGSSSQFNRLYKLYSSDKMMEEGIDKENSDVLLEKIEKDVDPRWDEYPDMYVDGNRPLRPTGAERRSDSPEETRSRLVYPIVDPSRYNGREDDKTNNTEGFVYGERSLSSVTVNGVDSRRGQLAMPLRWIYLLRDGTPGTVDKEGKFTTISKDGGEPTKDNPIVSRLAWWTDDETCKINVNIASIPVPWDTPRTASAEDVWYAQYPPVSGECQHYPGHPAQTDLCAVIFPGFRYTPDENAIPVGENMNALPLKYANLVWNIAPFITEKGGTQGGTQKVSPFSATPVPLDNDDHLFPTFEEFYFKARRAEKNLDRPRDSIEGEDAGNQILRRLEGSQFFLTTRSSGPEMTVFGTPRVCMFPMNEFVVQEVGKVSGAVNPNVGAYEVTMATNATIGAKKGVQGFAFYFQRSTNAGSRHNNFYNDISRRNALVFKYLKKLTLAIPPGYPELKGELDTFGEKYPGPNRLAGHIHGVQTDFDSTDRTQIVLSMLDMMRSSNMSPGYLESGASYDSGGGQVAGICGCNPIVTSRGEVQRHHTTALLIRPAGQPTVYTPKGSGRTYGPAEICFFAHVIATKREGQGQQGTVIAPANDDMAKKWNEAKTASLIQVGVLINSFSARQGWAPLFARSGINLSGSLPTSGVDPRSVRDGSVKAPFNFASAEPKSPLYIGDKADGFGFPPNLGAGVPLPMPGLIPWAGIAGPRVSANQNVAAFDTVAYTGAGAGGTNPVPVQLKWVPGEILRVFLYDEDPSANNTIQAIELALGSGASPTEMDAAYTGKSIETLMSESLSQRTESFPPPKLNVTSFVVPHGDYRLTTIPLSVERGIFVPHGNKAHSLVEPVLPSGRNAQQVKCRGAELAPATGKLLSAPGIPEIDDANAPHFAPVRQSDLCSGELGTLPVPGVLAAASSINQTRRLRFAHGRRDGQYSGPSYKPFSAPNTIPNRGSSDPLETGDFDNGVGLCPDGAYMNQPDDGDARDPNFPYYQKLTNGTVVNPATFSPNRVMRSPVDFGSIPSGLQARVPWQTLRFRPDPQMYNGSNIYQRPDFQPRIPDGYQHFFPFSNYCGPKDHLLLDMWWLPVVEPWSISEGFATKGLINLNQQILPFTYIQRTTALNALLRSERMMAIPDSAANTYKNGSSVPNNQIYRHWINAKETLRQLTEFRWKGEDAEGFTLPFNSFRSASEICELWLVPEKNGNGAESGTWDLEHVIRDFWKTHRLTGDNMRERPYANLYPRLTVRSNVYRVHMVAQTLKKASTNKPGEFKSVSEEGSDPDLVTAEWRGSALIERVLNPNEPELQKTHNDFAPGEGENVYDGMDIKWPAKLDNYYTYRVTEVKQFHE